MKKKRGLGKGLDALLAKPSAGAAGATKPDSFVPVTKLVAGAFQPRRRFDRADLAALAESVRQHGILQPIVARPVAGSDKYEIIAGERRWRAAQKVGLRTAPVIIRAATDDEAQLFALVENIQRADLNPIEQSNGIGQLIETFKLTHEQAAQKVGLSRAAVSNLLRLRGLAAAVRDMVQSGKLEMGHARALLALPAGRQAAAAREVVAGALTTRQTEQYVRRAAGGARRGRAAKDADTVNLEIELKQRLQMPVQIAHKKSGVGGKITITYGSLANLDTLIKKLRK